MLLGRPAMTRRKRAGSCAGPRDSLESLSRTQSRRGTGRPASVPSRRQGLALEKLLRRRRPRRTRGGARAGRIVPGRARVAGFEPVGADQRTALEAARPRWSKRVWAGARRRRQGAPSSPLARSVDLRPAATCEAGSRTGPGRVWMRAAGGGPSQGWSAPRPLPRPWSGEEAVDGHLRLVLGAEAWRRRGAAQRQPVDRDDTAPARGEGRRVWQAAGAAPAALVRWQKKASLRTGAAGLCRPKCLQRGLCGALAVTIQYACNPPPLPCRARTSGPRRQSRATAGSALPCRSRGP